MLPVTVSTPPTSSSSPVLTTAERLVRGIEGLVRELSRLRADNAILRREVRQAFTLIEAAGVAASMQGRVARKTATGGRGRRRGHAKTRTGRATPEEVTNAVVCAALVKLGEATAAEIAAEITLAGAPVGGRAVRFLAQSAGATVRVGEDGRRRYRLS
jgi:hypothetical protein